MSKETERQLITDVPGVDTESSSDEGDQNITTE